MSSNKFIGKGLTYDDVLLVPSYSDVLPKEVSINSKFSKNIDLNIPISSAAMDTVTESSMAIAIAREGGIGVLHKNMSIEDQAEQVRTVKRSESGMIMDPVTLNYDSLVIDAKEKMRVYKIGGIPIIDEKENLKGIVTNRDLRFEKNNQRPIKELMTSENIITVHEGITLKEAEKILEKNKIEKLPVVTKNNKLVGLITFRDISKQTKKPKANKDKYGRLRVMRSSRITKDVLERVSSLKDSDADAIVIDTAHAHSKNVAKVLKKIKNKFTDIDVIVGNIATAEAAIYLANEGADAVKVGIGPGSICTTRVIAGVGFPQLSAILEVSKALKSKSVPVIADGGIRYTGDIPKALAAGAICYVGSLLAGTKESPGETVIFEAKHKTYRGMGSVEAMKQGSNDRYFQDIEEDLNKLVPEGLLEVPFKGNLEESIHQFVGGLRSGMGYCGAKDIKTLQLKSKFVKISPASIKRSCNITITKEAPNYSP